MNTLVIIPPPRAIAIDCIYPFSCYAGYKNSAAESSSSWGCPTLLFSYFVRYTVVVLVYIHMKYDMIHVILQMRGELGFDSGYHVGSL